MRISFKRNGFIALASMLSFAVYAGDNLPLATAASGTNGSIQVSEHGVDTSNEIQQARVIQGTVLEEGTNEPLIGVNVVVKGTTIGTTTELALPYLGGVDSDDAIYANTRRFVWSEYNPYFFKGSYFEGIGGHHIGTDMIWPMSLIMKALTAQNDEELQQCIRMLQKTHAGTGFMHESFHKDDPKKFTRSWFAWANTLFGELLWKTFNEKPYLLEY